jgi:peptidoglycan-N-acetylglucosamine deacetylase
MIYTHKTPSILKVIYRKALFKIPAESTKKIYLTFDDGPVPDATEYVLDELEKFNAKASFFCVGENISKHPYVFQKVMTKGHEIGNHTFNHKNGFKTSFKEYVENYDLCEEQIIESTGKRSRLFRPPYGQIKTSQYKFIKKESKIVMWDVLSADFDPELSAESCLKNSIKHTEDGSIIVFHDNVKTFRKLQFVLPRYLQHFSEQGFGFSLIPNNIA